MQEKCVVLLSAGLDSTTNLYAAHNELQVVRAITFDYGQRAAKKEIEKSKVLCQHLEIPHQVIELPWLAESNPSSLVNRAAEVPTGSQVSIDDMQVSTETKKSVWVPNRNGVLLNIAAAVAEIEGAQWIVPGFNKEEAATFPDNSNEYLESVNQTLSFSTANGVRTKCFTIDMTKTEIASLARSLSVPMEHVWPCYFDGEELCGQCESCQRFFRAVNG